MDLLDWVQNELRPEPCDSEAFIYDDMDSQSGKSLSIIYVPFDAGQRSHWRDRGAAWDYQFSTRGHTSKILDLGPGDGWPSLIVAPFVGEVVGVEGSHRRVEVCRENAARLGISNARFLYVPPAALLPFADHSFDGAMAASSIEQTPDPKATLEELFRVLRPGGRLRLDYEALDGYRGGKERDVWLARVGEHRCRLILFDRHVDQGYAVQIGLTYDLAAEELIQALVGTAPLSYRSISVSGLTKILPAMLDARVCTTQHPSGRTWVSWMEEIGFSQVLPSHSGSHVAGRLFELLPEGLRPTTLEGIDDYLRAIVRAVVEMPAPMGMNPMITAIK
jgi:SAM-dependent methyltransferase